MKGYQNYDKFPELKIGGFKAWQGYEAIAGVLKEEAEKRGRCVIVFDCYTQVDQREVRRGLPP